MRFKVRLSFERHLTIGCDVKQFIIIGLFEREGDSLIGRSRKCRCCDISGLGEARRGREADGGCSCINNSRCLFRRDALLCTLPIRVGHGDRDDFANLGLGECERGGVRVLCNIFAIGLPLVAECIW